MTERTLSEEIILIIQDQITQIPQPTTATITKINDNGTVNIDTYRYGTLKYVPTYGKQPVINQDAILIFINGDFENHVIIC